MLIRYIINQTHPNGAHEIDGQIYSEKKANRFIQWMVAQCSQLKQDNEKLELDNKTLKAALTLSENALNNANKRIGGLIDKRV